VADVRFESVSKAFPGVQALADVSFDVPGGTVHALCGENGAGKSTLLKILSGVHRPDTGSVSIDGRPAVFAGARDAIRAGVAVIYQELQLVPDLSVAENLFLGDLPGRFGWIDQRRLQAEARRVLEPLGLDADPRTQVGDLPIAQRQLVEIGKALARKARVIAFDEPTSSLSVREVERLFEVIRGLRADGCAVLYVSHRMDEVQEVCDAATVLRDGRHVETFPSLEGVATSTIVERMVGRTLDEVFPYRARPLGDVRLEVRGLTGAGLDGPASLSASSGLGGANCSARSMRQVRPLCSMDSPDLRLVRAGPFALGSCSAQRTARSRPCSPQRACKRTSPCLHGAA
jgi:L-arabinose transport system ATP-binding protein